jgi:hypothetical protein
MASEKSASGRRVYYTKDGAICPAVDDVANWVEDEITYYDQSHVLTYARLLDAEKDGMDWRDAARTILMHDPDENHGQAWLCWETHLKRAHWIVTTGIRLAVARANAH